jgi:hypothetical protein
VSNLVQQSHGGALRNGGASPNGGALAKHIRRKLRTDFKRNTPLLQSIAEGKQEITIAEKCPSCGFEPPDKKQKIIRAVDTKDSLKAMEIQAKHGMAQNKGIPFPEIQKRLVREIDLIREVCPSDIAEILLTRLGEEVWK